MKEYILAINQHPSFPCQLVEKSLWPEEPVYCASFGENPHCLNCGCSIAVDHYHEDKLSALQAGAVFDPADVPVGICDIESTGPFYKTGVYELDPSRWAVEIVEQWRINGASDWHSSNYHIKDTYTRDQYETRQIAIISPVETPKEVKPITADDILGAFNSLPKREGGFSGIKVIERGFVKEGEPILMMHPKDFEKMKKDAAFGD